MKIMYENIFLNFFLFKQICLNISMEFLLVLIILKVRTSRSSVDKHTTSWTVSWLKEPILYFPGPLYIILFCLITVVFFLCYQAARGIIQDIR